MFEMFRPREPEWQHDPGWAPGAEPGPMLPAEIVYPLGPEDEASFGSFEFARPVPPSWTDLHLDPLLPDEIPADEFPSQEPLIFRPADGPRKPYGAEARPAPGPPPTRSAAMERPQAREPERRLARPTRARPAPPDPPSARPRVRPAPAEAPTAGPRVPPGPTRPPVDDALNPAPWYKVAPRRARPSLDDALAAGPLRSPPVRDAFRTPERRRPQPATEPRRHEQPTTPRPGVPAAEDPRIFVLQRMCREEAVRQAALEVETRPRRTYPRRFPGSSQTTEIRPEYHGVAVLKAATHAHGRFRTHGLGLMFPPHTVHARNSSSVVIGNNCELTQVDHVHIRQAVVAQDDALRSARVKEIVARAEPGRDNSAVVRDLRAALRDMVERPPEAGPTRVDQRLRAECVTSVHTADTVQLGDDCLTTLDSRYVVERTTIPAGALLADREDLAARYVALVAGPQDDPAALASFLGALVGAADNATDDNVLGYADGLPQQEATFLGLFGLVSVDHATSVMVGVGNTLHTELVLDTPTMRADAGIGHGVREHRATRPRVSPEQDPDPRETDGRSGGRRR
jgi:hypothetical protein